MGSKNYLDMRKYFWDHVQSQYTMKNVDNFKTAFDSSKGTEIDKKAAVDQSFRDILLEELVGDIQRIETLIDFSVECGRKNYATATIPVVLLGDAFDVMTLDQCEEMFSYVEKNVSVWKEDCFFAACKNNLLRMCNDLLRRLSRSQNTVFCGRILLFLAKFFPFSERSGLNIVSEFNLENVTEYGADGTEMGEQLNEPDENGSGKTVKIDYNLYCKFWALQDFFRNPNQCYDRIRWKTFETHSMHVLSAFSSCKLEETNTSKRKHSETEQMDVDLIENAQHFFAKFLTNPKLLALQLSDSNFRRSVLVQFLILFQYLSSTVKFKQDSFILNPQQNEWIKDTDAQIYKLLNETPPNGKKFAETVRHMLLREEIWSSWKNEGCKEFKKPEQTPDTSGTTGKPGIGKKPRKLLGDLVRDYTNSGKVYMGNPELTRLWNLCPDNLSACKGADRDFLPTFEEFLEQKPKDKPDSSFDWRALRLLARQSPHFFTLNNQSAKVSDCLETVSKRIKKEKEEKQTTNTTIEDIQNGEPNLTDGDNQLTEEMDAELIKEEGDSQDDSNNIDKHEHKAAVMTPEILKQLSDKIGEEWKRLAAKLGLATDEIQFIETENPGVNDQCKHMLTVWFDDDEDASLDNLAYILEGLEMLEASECAKSIIRGQEKVEEISD